MSTFISWLYDSERAACSHVRKDKTLLANPQCYMLRMNLPEERKDFLQSSNFLLQENIHLAHTLLEYFQALTDPSLRKQAPELERKCK